MSSSLSRRLLLFLAVFSVAALAQNPSLKSVEVGDINRSVSPCADFYEYANGAWRAQNPIPASMPRWSRRWAAGERNKEQLRAILDDLSQRRDWAKGSVEQLVSDHYAACMDEARINQLGARPLEPLLRDIDAMRSPADVQRMIRKLNAIAIPAPFGLTGTPDYHEPSQTIGDIWAAGIGMPDRDYYFKKEERFEKARVAYKAYVAKMFRLAGADENAAEQAAATVFAMESRLAEKQFDNVELRDPSKTDNKTSFAELRKLTPSFDWTVYFQEAGLPQAPLNVQQPNFMAAFERELAQTPLADWKTYLKWQLLNSAAPSLAQPFVEAHFDFYGRFLQGAKEMKPRWKRCVESTDALLGEALGRKYVEKHFPPAAKARMLELVHNELLAMKDIIEGLDWMSAATKKKALEKLSTFNPKIGYPDKWKDYSRVVIRRDAFWEDVMAGRRFNVADERATIGKPTDRGRWGMTPPTSDAYYNPLLNEIVFPAGILQPPAFSMEVVDAVNYGAIGVVIGHEISHGFDDQGAQFDAHGRLKNWWTDEDLEKFQQRGACVVRQYEEYDLGDGLRHNGKLVLGEAIGDLAGARIAYLAFQKAKEKRPQPDVAGFTPDQQFFIAWGQFRGDAVTPEFMRYMLQGDPHPIAKYRVLGPLENMPQFRKAFACKDSDPMVRPEAKRCEVW